MALSAWSSHSRPWIFVLSPFLALLLVYYLYRSSPDTYVETPPVVEDHNNFTSPPPTTPPSDDHEAHCHFVHGMEDVFVVLKTGATEVQEKLPVHLQTTLRCLPNYAVFSDFEEEVDGVRTHDTLRNIPDETKQSQPDFGIYNRLLTQGREGLSPVDWADDVKGPFGKPDNPGWRLDRWKFVPMVDEALRLRPDAKWYVFLEGDSYMVWPNLLAWLSRLDHTKPYYIGSPMQIGDIIFAYSGSGIILSNPAMRKVSKYRARRTKELDEYTANNWSGDCVLGKVLRDTQVPLVWSWPMQVTTRVWETDHFADGYGRRPWCYPAVSYHRMEPKDILDFHDFEQEWFRSGKNSLLLHSDIFRKLVQPDISSDVDDWDNLSTDPVATPFGSEPFLTPSDCAAHCSSDPNCLQYSFDNGKCLTSGTIIRGARRSNVSSGWMSYRIQTYMKYLRPCGGVEYVLQ